MKANVWNVVGLILLAFSLISIVCSALWSWYAEETILSVIAVVEFIAGAACSWIGERID